MIFTRPSTKNAGNGCRYGFPKTLANTPQSRFFCRRQRILFPKKFKLSASEFLDYELLLMRAKHLKHFQTARTR